MSYKTDWLKLDKAFFHIYNRGNKGGKIFFSGENYLYLLRKLKKYRDQFEIAIICYCLMPTHYHFLVKQLAPYAVSKFIGLTLNSYVKAINKQQKKSGHLFEGKYKMKLVENPNYLINLSAYIHANPVFDNLVSKPEQWRFSSYQDFIGLRSGTLPEPKVILNYFNSIEDYKKFVNGFEVDGLDNISPFLPE